MRNIILYRKENGKIPAVAIEALSTAGLKAVLNTSGIENEMFDWCFRWGCTSNIGADHVVNSAKAIHTMCHKAKSRRVLQEAGIPCPTTWSSLVDMRNVPFPVQV